MSAMSNVNFALLIINKDQLKDLQNHLNQKKITDNNTLDVLTLGDNLIMSNRVDYMIISLQL